MIILTTDEVIILHSKLIEKTGGLDGIRDLGMLESAIYSCMQTFNNEELYPSITEKAVKTAYSICKNHPFTDGNKRTAILIMLIMLKLNNVNITYTQEELIELGLNLAKGIIYYDEVVSWIQDHKD